MAEYKGKDAFIPIDASVTDTFAPPDTAAPLPHVTLTPREFLTLLTEGRVEIPETAVSAVTAHNAQGGGSPLRIKETRAPVTAGAISAAQR